MKTLVLTDEQLGLLWDAVNEAFETRDGAVDFAESEEEVAELRAEASALSSLLDLLS